MPKLFLTSRQRFIVLICAVLSISLILVLVSLWLYRISGAAQLDLSRPGYQDIRDQVEHEEGGLLDFESSGVLNSEVITDFEALYDQQATKAKAVDAFGGDPLNPDSLGLFTTENQ